MLHRWPPSASVGSTSACPSEIALELGEGPLEDGASYPEDLADTTVLKVKTVKNSLTTLRRRGKVEPTGNRRDQAEQVSLVSSPPSPIRDRDWDTAGDQGIWA